MATIANVRQIHTGLYTKAAQDCLDSVIGQLSDGMWESTPSMAKYWEFACIVRADDGEVLINVSTDMCMRYSRCENGFYHKTDFDVMQFFANKIKAVVKAEWPNSWSRTSIARCEYLTRWGKEHPEIEIRDAYLAYEVLKGRSRAVSKYPSEVVEKVVGSPLTPEMIEVAKKIKELQAKQDDELNTAKFEFDKTCADIKSKYEEQINELKKAAT